MATASGQISYDEYVVLSEETRELLRLENLYDVLIGSTERKRQLASSADLERRSSSKYAQSAHVVGVSPDMGQSFEDTDVSSWVAESANKQGMAGEFREDQVDFIGKNEVRPVIEELLQTVESKRDGRFRKRNQVVERFFRPVVLRVARWLENLVK